MSSTERFTDFDKLNLAIFADCDLVTAQAASKITLDYKVVKRNSNMIISFGQSKSVTHFVCQVFLGIVWKVFNGLNTTFQVFCWTDKWHGMTMEDIRRLEDQTKAELEEQLKTGEVRGTKPI